MADNPDQRAYPTMRPAVREAYGPADLSGNPVFAGGFINFGYWRAIDLDRPPSEADRIRSQEDLYRHVLDAAGLPTDPEILEVGCGLGMGCAVALREYGPVAVVGMDIHPEQLQRARGAQAPLLRADPARLSFVQGAAEHMPLEDGTYDAVISVEAAQHFPDLLAFAAETARVLRPGGRAAVASFFTVDDAPGRPMNSPACWSRTRTVWTSPGRCGRSPTRSRRRAGGRAHRVDRGACLAGLGPLAQPVVGPGTWPRNFLHAYDERILDYYVVTAGRPG
ncbi:class I SAM-dependent methyltransferase [Streptomyces sp. M19]